MNSKTKIFFTIFGGLAAILLFFVLGFSPLLTSIKALNADLVSKKGEQAKLTKQISEYKSAQSDLARATFQQEIYSSIVVREDLAIAIEDLEAVANTTETVESIQIKEVDKTTGGQTAVPMFQRLTLTEEVPYTMVAKSDFVGMVNFMEYLEHLPHFTEFKNISFSAVVENIPADLGGGTVNTGDLLGNFEGVFLVKKGQPNEN